VEALGGLGPDGKDAVGALREVLSNPDPGLRLAAVHALGSVGSAAKEAVPDLIALLGGDDAALRAAAAEALGDVGPDAEKAVDPLVRALDPTEPVGLRRNAACALGGIGPKAAKARDPLRKRVADKDEDQSVRVFAAYALCTVTEGRDWALAKPVFLEALGQANPDLRATAARVLGAVGLLVKDKDAAQALEARSKDEKETDEVRRAAQTALKQIADAAGMR
jgi:HEAT repeat protein